MVAVIVIDPVCQIAREPIVKDKDEGEGEELGLGDELTKVR
jgi:hypothetical protein